MPQAVGTEHLLQTAPLDLPAIVAARQATTRMSHKLEWLSNADVIRISK
jgi:hypothetical protein